MVLGYSVVYSTFMLFIKNEAKILKLKNSYTPESIR